MSYEYKVVPAPTRGLKAKGIKTPEDRFANALETEMNALAAKGWEYVRTDTLPCEQREGLMSKTTVYQNMLVFRREKSAAQTAPKTVAAPHLTATRPGSGEEPRVEKRILPAPKPATPPAKPAAAKTDDDGDVAAE